MSDLRWLQDIDEWNEWLTGTMKPREERIIDGNDLNWDLFAEATRANKEWVQLLDHVTIAKREKVTMVIAPKEESLVGSDDNRTDVEEEYEGGDELLKTPTKEEFDDVSTEDDD